MLLQYSDMSRVISILVTEQNSARACQLRLSDAGGPAKMNEPPGR